MKISIYLVLFLLHALPVLSEEKEALNDKKAHSLKKDLEDTANKWASFLANNVKSRSVSDLDAQLKNEYLAKASYSIGAGNGIQDIYYRLGDMMQLKVSVLHGVIQGNTISIEVGRFIWITEPGIGTRTLSSAPITVTDEYTFTVPVTLGVAAAPPPPPRK